MPPLRWLVLTGVLIAALVGGLAAWTQKSNQRTAAARDSLAVALSDAERHARAVDSIARLRAVDSVKHHRDSLAHAAAQAELTAALAKKPRVVYVRDTVSVTAPDGTTVVVQDSVPYVPKADYDDLGLKCTATALTCAARAASAEAERDHAKAELREQAEEAAARERALAALRRSLPTRAEHVKHDAKVGGVGFVVGVVLCVLKCPSR